MKRGFSTLLLVVLLVGLLSFPVAAGLGIKATSMAGAYGAVSNDGEAVFSNPAGLALLTDRQLLLSYGFVVDAETPLYLVSYVEPDYGNGAGGLSFVHNKSESGGLTKLTYSVARSVRNNLAAGISVRYQSYVPEHPLAAERQNFTSDLGILINPQGTVTLGIMVEDMIGMPLRGGSEQLPVNIRPAAAIKVPNFGLLAIEVNDVFNNLEEQDWRVGAQWNASDKIAVRFGWREGIAYSASHWSAGVGFNQPGWSIDYALTGVKDSWKPETHQVGISFAF